MELVAQELGNTPAVSRSAYVHPSIIEAYLEGDLAGTPATSARKSRHPVGNGLGSLKAREAALVSLLRRRRLQAASASKRSSARR